MKRPPIVLAALFVTLLIVGCDKPATVQTRTEMTPRAETKTFETTALRMAIDRYESNPTDEASVNVRKALAELDGEIVELDRQVAEKTGAERVEADQKRVNLRSYRDAEMARYAKAQIASGVPAPVESAGDRIKETAKDLGNTIEDAAKKAGEGVKDAANDLSR